MAGGPGEPMVQPRKKKSTDQMAMRVGFMTGATRGIGAEIAKTARVDGNQVVASDRKPQAVTYHLPLTQSQKLKKCRSANLETAASKSQRSVLAAWE
jgi:NAD(P)-dependent dehydrogenase (short-subunit alcohol dehydrogenase family)